MGDSAQGKGFKLDPSSPELQESQRQGVPLPKDPQKKLDSINADVKAVENKYGLKLDPNDPQYGRMLQTLAGKGSKDDFNALLALVPEGQQKSFKSDFARRGSLPPSGFPRVAHEIKFSKEEAQALIENINIDR